MQRAAAREEKIEKVEDEVKPDVSFGSSSTISRRWYFSLFNSNNLHFSLNFVVVNDDDDDNDHIHMMMMMIIL